VTHLTVVRPGMLTTVQDLGRWGQQHLGVPVAGPMDWYSHRLANRLVGNPEDAAALEITLLGPEVTADADLMCAVAGGVFEISCGGAPVAMHTPFRLPRGERLVIRGRTAGARATLAVAGGIAVPPVLGSRSTSLLSRLGPFGGRALMAGDVLPVGSPGAHRGQAAPASAVEGLPLPAGGTRLRVVMGPHDARFSDDARRTFLSSRYVVTPDSNRMGYRLDGAVLAQREAGDMLSDATPIGSLQVPSSGLPILLMADRQTTGGYPKIATVITADLPLAGQLAPGDWIEFAACSRRAAVDALRRRHTALAGLAR
jgi:antagonist of KipI